MKIGTYVCDKEDEEMTDPAIIVYNDNDYPTINIIKRTDGHLSTRDDEDLKIIEPIDFMKVWCEGQIGYGEL